MFKVLTQEEIGHFIKAAGPDGKGPQYYEMTQEHIDETVAGFASAAVLAQKAGFDGVELHAGHGYLIASFLSPYTNKRTDGYGGSRENRARFLLEIIKAVRAATSDDFAILIRLDAKEYRVEGGIELADCLVTVKLAEQAGVDAIDVSAYGNTAHAIAFTEAPLVHEPGGFIDFAKAVKQVVNVPVIGVGRIEAEWASSTSPPAISISWPWAANCWRTRTCPTSWRRARRRASAPASTAISASARSSSTSPCAVRSITAWGGNTRAISSPAAATAKK